MVTGMLVGFAAEVALVNLVMGLFVAWGFSGGDGEAPNIVAPALGVGVFAGTIAALVTTMGTLQGATLAAMVIVLIAAAAAWMWWLGRHEDDRVRRQAYPVIAVVAIVVPLLVGMLGAVDAVTWRDVVIAAIAPGVMLVSIPIVARFGPPEIEGGLRDSAIAMGIFSAPPALLAAARLLG